jgi:hypothetical protein
MNYSAYEISAQGYAASLYTYLLDTPPELNGGKDRPMVIVYPRGGHGLALGTAETATPNLPPNLPSVSGWIDLAVNWILGFQG